MQNSVTDTVTISVLDREFKIKCPQNKTSELKKAAAYLDNKMREVHHGNKLITIDRIAITAALNITHELIQTEQLSQSNICDIKNRLLNLKHKIHQTLVNTK